LQLLLRQRAARLRPLALDHLLDAVSKRLAALAHRPGALPDGEQLAVALRRIALVARERALQEGSDHIGARLALELLAQLQSGSAHGVLVVELADGAARCGDGDAGAV